MSFIKYEYININEYSRPGIRNIGIDGIVMHYTANKGGTARNHKDYFNNLKGNYASAQLFVDDIEAICIIPLNEVAYHANEISKYNSDGSRYRPLFSKIGNANYSTIGVEMCLDKNGNITEKTFQNTVKAVKELIAIYPNITRDKIWRHFDVTGKNCPAPWVDKPSELERFKNGVFSKSNENSNTANAATKSKEEKRRGLAMFVYTLITKDGKGQLWGVNGNTRFHFATTAEYEHYLKIVKANGGDTTRTNQWKEGSPEVRAVELMAPNVSQK